MFLGKSVYLSQSGGSDANTGLTTGQAKATWAAAYALLTPGSNDELVVLSDYSLADGESFTVAKPGLGVGARLTVRGYMAPNSAIRPILRRVGQGYVFRLHSAPNFSDFTCLRDLDINGNAQANGGGISIYTTGGGILIENVAIRDTRLNAINMTGESGTNLDGVDVVKCQIFDIMRTAGGPHVQGAYVEYCRNIRFIETLFDHCGRLAADDSGTQFNHNLYSHSSAVNVQSLNCISARSSATGLQHRCNNQIAIGNLLIDCALGITFGHDDFGAQWPGTAVGGSCIGNAVIGATDISAGEPRKGPGIGFGYANGLTITDNIIAHCPSTTTAALKTDRPSINVTGSATVVNNWGGAAYEVTGTANPAEPTVSVAAPINRAVPTIAQYLTSIGVAPGGDAHATFLALCRANTGINTDPRFTASAVNAFLRASQQTRRSWRFAAAEHG